WPDSTADQYGETLGASLDGTARASCRVDVDHQNTHQGVRAKPEVHSGFHRVGPAVLWSQFLTQLYSSLHGDQQLQRPGPRVTVPLVFRSVAKVGGPAIQKLVSRCLKNLFQGPSPARRSHFSRTRRCPDP